MASVYPAYSGTPWYDFDVYSDYPQTSYMNTDVGTPTDTPLSAPLSGTVTNDSYEPWGGQITVRADDPGQIGGHPYYFLIHLDSLNPNIGVGTHVNQGDFLGWSGGELDTGGLSPLPGGLQHHVTSPEHSTGPHLDIGVGDTPDVSMDASQYYSNQLVNIARQNQIAYGTGQGSIAGIENQATKADWAYALLGAIGNDNPDPAQVQFVSAWEHAESGSGGGAANNPLNTTEQNTPGVVSPFNTFGDAGQYHVWNYDTFQHGIQAEAKVLQNGNYDPLLQALQTPGAASDAALGVPGGQPSQGVVASLDTWGTTDWSTIYSTLNTAGAESITASGASSSSLCDYCNSLPQNARPAYCAFCSAASAVSNAASGAAGSLLPSWLTTPPWANKDLLNALERAGFIILGGGLLIAAGILLVHSTGEATGINSAVHQAQGKVLEIGGAATGAPTTIEGAVRSQRQEHLNRKREDTARANRAIAGAEAHKKAITKAQEKAA